MSNFGELTREAGELISEGNEIKRKISFYVSSITSLEREVADAQLEIRVAMMTDEEGNYLGDVENARNKLRTAQVKLETNKELLKEAEISLENNKAAKLEQVDKMVKYNAVEQANLQILQNLSNKRFGNIAGSHIGDVSGRIKEVEESRVELLRSMDMNANALSDVGRGEVGGVEAGLTPREVVVIEGQRRYADEKGHIYRIGKNLVPDNEYNLNGYKYRTDSKGRIISAEGYLILKKKEKEGSNKRKGINASMSIIGKGYQKPTDQRGHLIADMFDGDNGLGNLVPQDGHLNDSDVKKLEEKLAAALADNKKVYLKVEPVYPKLFERGSQRPKYFRYTYIIDGETSTRWFRNERS